MFSFSFFELKSFSYYKIEIKVNRTLKLKVGYVMYFFYILSKAKNVLKNVKKKSLTIFFMYMPKRFTPIINVRDQCLFQTFFPGVEGVS